MESIHTLQKKKKIHQSNLIVTRELRTLILYQQNYSHELIAVFWEC